MATAAYTVLFVFLFLFSKSLDNLVCSTWLYSRKFTSPWFSSSKKARFILVRFAKEGLIRFGSIMKVQFVLQTQKGSVWIGFPKVDHVGSISLRGISALRLPKTVRFGSARQRRDSLVPFYSKNQVYFGSFQVSQGSLRFVSLQAGSIRTTYKTIKTINSIQSDSSKKISNRFGTLRTSVLTPLHA